LRAQATTDLAPCLKGNNGKDYDDVESRVYFLKRNNQHQNPMTSMQRLCNPNSNATKSTKCIENPIKDFIYPKIGENEDAFW